jgi:hypothetical protein
MIVQAIMFRQIILNKIYENDMKSLTINLFHEHSDLKKDFLKPIKQKEWNTKKEKIRGHI